MDAIARLILAELDDEDVPGPGVHRAAAAVREQLSARQRETSHGPHVGVHHHDGVGAREAEQQPFARAGPPPALELGPAPVPRVRAPRVPVVQDLVARPAHEAIPRRDSESVVAAEVPVRLLLGNCGEGRYPCLDLARLHVEQEQAGVPGHLLAGGVAGVREARDRERLGRVDLADAEVLGGEHRYRDRGGSRRGRRGRRRGWGSCRSGRRCGRGDRRRSPRGGRRGRPGRRG